MTDQSWVEEVSSSELWKLFTPSIFGDLAKAPIGQGLRTLLRALVLEHGGRKSLRLSDVYEAAFAHLSRNQPAEYFYKNAILQRNVLSRHGSKRSRVFFEFRAGRSKLDALVARESMHAYEIKTELDHYRRLPSQIADYQQRFAHVSILSSERQVGRLEKQVPPSVGLAYMSRRRTFEVVRPAARYVDNLRAEAILECLRRQEYLKVLRTFGFSDSEVPNTVVFRTAMIFSRKLDPEMVHEATLERLKERPRALSVTALARLPIYVRAAAVASHYDDEDVEVLLGNLAERVGKGGV